MDKVVVKAFCYLLIFLVPCIIATIVSGGNFQSKEYLQTVTIAGVVMYGLYQGVVRPAIDQESEEVAQSEEKQKAREAKSSYNQGLAQAKKKEYGDSIEHFTQAIKLSPEFVKAYIGRALAYRKTGEVEKALSDCNRAIKLDPENPEAYKSRALTYKEQGETELAKADLLHAEDLSG